MRTRTALVLVVLATGVAVAAMRLGGGGEITQLPQGAAMFPGLAAALPAAARVEITHLGTQLVLTRGADGWTIPAHGGYPVDGASMRTLLGQLAALRLMEPRTADAGQFGRLGLEPVTSPDAAGTLIRVLDAGGKTLASVILGHDVPKPEGQGADEDMYVRRPEAGPSWLAHPMVEASADWHDWARQTLLDVRADDVTHIMSQRGDAPAIEVARQDGKLVLTAPAEHPPLDQFKIDDMGRALSSLEMLDVRPAADLHGTKLGKTAMTTEQGMTVTADVAQDGSAIWLTLSAHGDGTAADAATTIQSHLSGWAFQVQPWKEAALVPRMSDLAAYEAPTPPAAAATAAQAPETPRTGGR